MHLSTVELLKNQNNVIVGDFVGKLYIIDLRSSKHDLKHSEFKVFFMEM